MANAITYIKNVGKSIGYASVSVFKEKNPVFADFAETNGELVTDMYKSVKDLKKNIKRLPEKIMESEYGQFGKTYLENLMDDLKTGKLYNKEREDEYTSSAADSFSDGLDMDVFNDFGDSDLDISSLDDDIPSTNEMMDIVGEKSSTAISTAVARSAEYIVQANAQSSKAMSKNINAIYGGIHTGMSAINQNISKILEFSNENMNLHFENSKTFYTEMTRMNQEQTQYLKEISETLKVMNEPPKTSEYKSAKYTDVISSEGNLDLSNYGKLVKKNIMDNTGLGMIVDAVKMAESAGGLKTFAASPLQFVVEGMVSSIIPKALEKSMENLNKSLSGMIGNMLMTIRQKSEDIDSGGGIWTWLNEIFGINTERRTSINPGQYEKGKVPFDGITRKAIIEVIPTYLSKILTALTGNKRDTFDYDSGKFVTVESLQKKIDNMTVSGARNAASDMDEVFRKKVDSLNLDTNELKAFKEFWENTKLELYKDQKRLETRDRNFELYSDPTEDGRFTKLLKEMFDNTPENLAYANRMYSQIASQSRQMEGLQGSSSITSLFNEDMSIDKDIPVITGLFSNANQAIVDKLNEIHKELAYIRMHGIGGSGGGSDKTKSQYSYKLDMKSYKVPGASTDKESETPSNKKDDSSSELGEAAPSITIPKDRSLMTLEGIEAVQKQWKDYDEYRRNPEKFKGRKIPQQPEISKIELENLKKNLLRKRDKESNKKKTLSDRIADLKKGALGIVQGPMNLASSLIDRVDARLYELVYGPITGKEEDDDRTLKEILFDKIENSMNNISDFIQEKIINPLTTKSLKENAHDAAKKFLSIFGIDLDKSIEGIKKFIFGEDEDGNRTKGGFLGKFVNDFKETFKSAGEWIKGGFKSLGDETGVTSKKNEKGLAKEKTKSKSNQIANEIGKTDKDGNPINPNLDTISKIITDNVAKSEEKATGARRVSKTGLAVISEGEMIIPPDMNPFNISKRYRNERKVKRDIINEINAADEFAEGNVAKDKWKQANRAERIMKSAASKKDEEERKKYLETVFKYNSQEDLHKMFYEASNQKYNKSDYEEGRNPVTERIIEEAGNGIIYIFNKLKQTADEHLTISEEDSKKFKGNASNVLKDILGNSGTLAAGATIGTGVSLLTGLVGGPLFGAAAGAAVALTAKSKTVQKMLFGDDETGEKGLLPKDFTNALKKYLPSMGLGGAMGGILSMIPGIPGGPLAGIMVGSAIGFVKQNQKAQEAIFGEDKLLGTKENFMKKVKSVLPKMGAGALVGALAGPFGPATNILLGSALGFASDTDKFKDLIFGEVVDPKTGKREGGIFDAVAKPMAHFFKDLTAEFKEFIKTDIFQPLKDAVDPIKKQFELMGKGIMNLIGSLIKNHIAIPLEKRLREKFLDPLGNLFTKLFNPAKGIFKGIVSAPFKAIGGVGDALRRHQIKSGNADYMSAAERVAYRESKGWKMKWGDPREDRFHQLDKSMVNASDDDLSFAKDTLSSVMGVHKSTDELRQDSFKNISKALRPRSIDYDTSRAVKKMIQNGDYEGARKFVENANIEASVKNSLLRTINIETEKIKKSYEMKDDAKGTISKIGEELRKRGFELDDKSIEKISKGGKEAQKIIDMISGEEKYRTKHGIQKSPEQVQEDKTDTFREKMTNKTDEIIELLKKLNNITEEAKELQEETVSDSEDNNRASLPPAVIEEEDGTIRGKASDFVTRQIEKIKARYRVKGSVSASLGLAKDAVFGTARGAGKLGAGALKLGSKGLKFAGNEALGMYDALRDTPFFTQMWGDRDVDWHNPGEKKDRSVHQSKILNWWNNRNKKSTDEKQLPAVTGQIDPKTGLNSYDLPPTLGYRLFGDLSSKLSKLSGIAMATAYHDGVDLNGIDRDDNPKSFGNKLKSFIQKAKNKFKKKKTVEFVNGRPVVYTYDKDGNPIVDASNAENEETFDIIEANEETQRGILAGLTAIPNTLGGLLGKLFGDKDEEKESIFDKILNFFTGDGKSGISLLSILKSAIPAALLALGLTGKLDNIANAITGGLFGKKDSNKSQTVKDANGNNVEIQVDENGNPILDENGNYKTLSGESISGDSYRNTTGALTTMSLSDRLKYNLVRGTVTGKGSIVGTAFKGNKLLRSAKTAVGKATGKAVKTSGISTFIKATTDKGAMDDVINALLDNTDTFINALKHVPVLGKYVNEEALINLSVGIGDLIERYLPKAGANTVKLGKSLSKLALPVAIATAIADFSTGWQDASTILKIKPEDVKTHHKIICGLVRTFKNLIPIVGTFIPDQAITDLFINHVAKWFGMDVSEIKDKQAAAKAEMEAAGYTSWSEYNKKVNGQYTWTEKIGNGVSSAISNIKEKGLGGAAVSAIKNTGAYRWASNTASNISNKVQEFGSNVKNKVSDFISPAVDAVKEKIGVVTDLGSYARNVVRDTWDEMISGEAKDSDNLVIDENDPYASHKKIIYNTVKILGIIPSAIVKLGKTAWDKIKSIGEGIASIGRGAGTTAQTMMSKAWSGDVVGMFADTSGNVASESPLLSGISNVVNTAVKIPLAIPALLTAGIGTVARGIGSIISGVKTIGSNVNTTISSVMNVARSGGDPTELLLQDTSTQTGNALIDTISDVIIKGVKMPLTPIALITSSFVQVKNKISSFFGELSQAGQISEADKSIIERAKNGEISPLSKEYWSVNTSLTGAAAGFNSVISMMNKVINLPMALVAHLNPLKLIEKGSDWIASKFGIDDSETKAGKGSGLYGRGSEDHQVEGSNFISQVDPKYRNIPFNISGDSQRQTIGDSGCAPAAAAMAINSTVGGASMEDASKLALKYKVKDDGVRASYFDDEFSRHGLQAQYSSSSSDIKNQLMNNNKVVIMGQDKGNTSKANSPFGPNPHYVTATGMSRDGKYVYINDPEANRPNIKYSANKVLGSSKLGIAAARGSKAISNRFRKYVARGTYGADTVQYKVWNALRNAGYGEIAVAAAMGNIQHESGFRADAIEKGSGAGFGLVQWTGGRRTAYENYAAQNGANPSDLEYQIKYLLKELDANSGIWTAASSRYGLGGMKRSDWANGTDLVKATQAFMCCFERPSYDPNVNHIDSRIQSASEYYEAFTGTKIDTNLNYNSYKMAQDTVNPSDPGSTSSSTSGASVLSNIITAFSGLAEAYGLTGSKDNTSSSSLGSFDSNSETSEGGLTYNNTVQSADGNVSKNPTHAKMQKKLVEQMYAIQGKLRYAQGNSKYPGSRNPEDGSGDCSSTVQWAYKKILGADPGSWTGDQRTNATTFTVRSGPDATKDESWLQLGDLLLKDGHVEMYAGNNTMIGHGGGKDGQTPGPTVKKLDQSGKYDLVRRWIGFRGQDANVTATGSGLAYNNALHYISGQGADLPSIPLGISPSNTSTSQYNNNSITSNMPAYINNTGSKKPLQNNVMSNDIIEIIKSIVGLLTQIVTNTAQLNNIVKLLGDFMSATSQAASSGTQESKDNAILAKQSLINAMQNTAGTNEPNAQLQRLIEAAEKIARA